MKRRTVCGPQLPTPMERLLNYPPSGPPSVRGPGYQPGPQRRTTWLWISLAIAVIIIVVLAAVVITQLTVDKSNKSTPAAPQPSATQSAPPPSGTQQRPNGGAGQTMTCEGYTASVDAGSQPGWQPTVGKRGLAYAVPPDWTVAKCGAQMGWQKPCPDGQQGACVIRAFSAVSTLADPSCDNGNLAKAGVAGSKNPDIKAALEDESKTVPIIYTSNSGQAPKVDFGPVREFTIGAHPAVQMVATVTDIAGDACTGPSALHSMVVTTVPNVEGSVVFLISLRQGAQGAPNPNVINEMVKTLRSPA